MTAVGFHPPYCDASIHENCPPDPNHGPVCLGHFRLRCDSRKKAAPTPAVSNGGTVTAASLDLAGTGFYIDAGKWAAIDPNKRKTASVKFTAPARNGAYHTGGAKLTPTAPSNDDWLAIVRLC